MDKLCHAYAYGKGNLAVKTLNYNFDLDITDFVSVNFEQITDIVDMLGGIDVDISESERLEFNKYIEETSNQKIDEAGLVHLDGSQTLCYSRIRACDGDNERTNRQRVVLSEIFNKLINTSPLKYPMLIEKFLPYVTTSLEIEEMLDIGLKVITNSPSLYTCGIPNEFINYEGGKIDGKWYYIYDIDTAKDMINKYIYEDIEFSQYQDYMEN